MSYVGNAPAVAYSNTVKDTFSGDGSTVAFTLSVPSTTNNVRVVVENVVQDPTVAYGVSGTTLTFTSAPPSGTDNIYVVHLGPAVQTVQPPTELSGNYTLTGDLTQTGDYTLTGTAEATNLTRGGSQVFSRDNILGTVSETSGVPTGAIIERGSNANGEYVKYADGTMICTRSVSGVDLTGAIAVTTVSTPASFSSQPTFYCSGLFATSNENNFSAVAAIGFVDGPPSSLNRWRFAKSNTQNGIASSTTILLCAIGRWF